MILLLNGGCETLFALALQALQLGQIDGDLLVVGLVLAQHVGVLQLQPLAGGLGAHAVPGTQQARHHQCSCDNVQDGAAELDEPGDHAAAFSTPANWWKARCSLTSYMLSL